MEILFYAVYLFWLGSEIYIARRRAKSTDKQNADRGSLYLLWIVLIIGNIVSLKISNQTEYYISQSVVIQYLGLGIILLGVLLRLIIVRSLGQYFTVNVTIRESHQLKTDGFYTHVRHPSYSALILSFMGFGVSLNNWMSLAVVTICAFGSFLYRINLEEKVLIDHFGQEYLDYRKKTRRLIPFIF
ncbi:MAG: methyltransferase family protein [Bacteroidota bacterium]